MNKFKVIKKQSEPGPDYGKIYIRLIRESINNRPFPETQNWIYRHVYLLVKGLPALWRNQDESAMGEETARPFFTLCNVAEFYISKLTPRELTRIFPVTKEYDGLKHGWKDYFTTMEELNKIGMDKTIGDHAGELVFDYQNRHIRSFGVFKISVVDVLRRYQGQYSMMEEFMSEQGGVPMRMITTGTGKQVLPGWPL